jgi:DNA-binding protein HU-beta
MNKVDLIRSAMERLELARKDAVALVDGLFEDIQDAVIAGEAVKIPGFGQFKVRDRAARIARNPATGEPVKVPAKRVFKFLPAKRGGGRKKAAAPARKKAAPAKKAAGRKAAAPARKGAAKKSAGRKKR